MPLKEARIKRRQRTRQWVFDYKKERGCKDCGEKDPLVLEFDHVHGKTSGISQLIERDCFSRLKEELELCEVVCANCHRRRTYKRDDMLKYIL